MRKPIIAGNWKMYKGGPKAATELAQGLVASIGDYDKVDVVLCPPFTALSAVVAAVAKSKIKVGAQNIYPAEEGAYTGEITADFLKELGVQYVIIGHSERRKYFQESDEFINQKVKFALGKGLSPIMCMGETWEQREKGETEAVVEKQISQGLADFTAVEIEKITLAYEPIWAIGTGKTARPEDAQAVHLFIRNWIKQKYGEAVAENTRIQYGGSVKPENVAELMAQPDIDGALVGGASLKPDSFNAIVKFG